MIAEHYPALFADDAAMSLRAQHLAKRTHELVSFLADVLGVKAVDAEWRGIATYHDACSGLRELGVKDQPRRLLASVRGLELSEMRDPEVCCGFGGTFCVKYPAISDHMVGDKTANIRASGAELVLAGDLGCLMNIAGKLRREGSDIEVRHVAELLAGMTADPAIGEPG
jgi:L-lactate dehydrogenase complex protein LldE